jgi:hypothetical protein
MTITHDSPLLPSSVSGLQLLPVRRDLWRVIDARGRALGHVLTRGTGPQRRYVAQRFRVAERAFRDVGAFWTLQEAIECLRLSR